MKIINTLIPILAATSLFISCGEEKKEEKPVQEITETPVVEVLPNTLYVIAPSGLLMRKEANLNSEQVTKMPYGSSVEVISRPENSSIDVANISAPMIQIKYNDITGFAFSGYLSRFKVPQSKEKPEAYATRLKEDFSEVTTNASTDGNAPTNVQVSIPAGSWSEAFLVAKQLFDIPSEYIFPGLNGPAQSSVKSSQEHRFTSSLEANRTNNDLTDINYIESANGYTRTVTITKNNNLYTISKKIIAD